MQFALDKAIELIDSDLTNEELLYAIRQLQQQVKGTPDEGIFESVHRIMIAKGRHAAYGPSGSVL